MLNTRAIRRKIRVVQNVQKITTAMQMVAAAKLRRVQERALAGRPYAEKMRQVLQRVSAAAVEIEHPLLEQREPHNVSIAVIGSNRGLCGSYNTNLFRKVEQFARELGASNLSLITIGRKARLYFQRREYNVRLALDSLSGESPHAEIRAAARQVRGLYEQRETDKLFLAYTAFLSVSRHQPTIVPLLPLQPIAPPTQPAEIHLEYLFEPKALQLLSHLLPVYVDSQFYQYMLEASASEQAARMIAMRQASDNAKELIDRLTLDFNKSRQAAITKELLEVVAGAEALKG